jgi:WD and tetratricopeptide repeat-containing protein 1
MRTLSVTFLSFSPDGSELLVNLGGEQLYLFGMNKSDSVKFKYNSYTQLFAEELAELSKNFPTSVQSSDEPKPTDVAAERQNNK